MDNALQVGITVNGLGNALLLIRLVTSKNAQALSLKSIDLYLLAYTIRYLELFQHPYSAAYSVVKVFNLVTMVICMALIRRNKFIKNTYDRSIDNCPILITSILPSIFITIAFHVIKSPFTEFLESNYKETPQSYLQVMHDYWYETIYMFSLAMEALAMIPQLFVLRKYKEVECLTGCYIGCKALYKFYYLFSDEYFFRHSDKDIFLFSLFCDCIQTMVGLILIFLLKRRGWKMMHAFFPSTYRRPKLSRLSKEKSKNDILWKLALMEVKVKSNLPSISIV